MVLGKVGWSKEGIRLLSDVKTQHVGVRTGHHLATINDMDNGCYLLRASSFSQIYQAIYLCQSRYLPHPWRLNLSHPSWPFQMSSLGCCICLGLAALIFQKRKMRSKRRKVKASREKRTGRNSGFGSPFAQLKDFELKHERGDLDSQGRVEIKSPYRSLVPDLRLLLLEGVEQ